jgi:hypothetical protein
MIIRNLYTVIYVFISESDNILQLKVTGVIRKKKKK